MSSPKAKAKELIDKMYNSEYCGIKHFPNKRYCECVEMNLFQAKQCALIAVDEILKANPIIPLKFMLESEALDAANEYWAEVKQEIEKL